MGWAPGRYEARRVSGYSRIGEDLYISVLGVSSNCVWVPRGLGIICFKVHISREFTVAWENLWSIAAKRF